MCSKAIEEDLNLVEFQIEENFGTSERLASLCGITDSRKFTEDVEDLREEVVDELKARTATLKLVSEVADAYVKFIEVCFKIREGDFQNPSYFLVATCGLMSK